MLDWRGPRRSSEAPKGRGLAFLFEAITGHLRANCGFVGILREKRTRPVFFSGLPKYLQLKTALKHTFLNHFSPFLPIFILTSCLITFRGKLLGFHCCFTGFITPRKKKKEIKFRPKLSPSSKTATIWGPKKPQNINVTNKKTLRNNVRLTRCL